MEHAQDCVLLMGRISDLPPSQRGFVLSQRMPVTVCLRSTEELSVITSCSLFKKIH